MREEGGAKRQAGSIDRKAIITVPNNRKGQNSMHCHDCVVRDNPLFIEEVWSVSEARCETSEGRGNAQFPFAEVLKGLLNAVR
jgi:hypothetical protein